MARFLDFLRSPRFPIFMIVFTDVLGLGITIPVLPLYAKNELGAAAWQITSLTSVFFGAQFLAGPILGRLSDRFGRRPVLMASQAGTLTALLITGLAPGIVFLYLARLIDGLTGGNISVAQAYLSDITDERNRARGLGLVNASFSLGFVFGPAFGSLLASFFGPRVPFFAAACVSLLTVLLTTFLLPESLTPERQRGIRAQTTGPAKSNWQLLRLPSLALLLLMAFGVNLGFFSFQSTYVLWLERLVFTGRPESFVQQAVGAILTAVGLFGIVAQTWLVAPLIRRFGEKHLAVFGNLSRGLAFTSLALFPSLATVILAIPMMSIGGGVALPALIALLTFAAPPGDRGRVIGLNQSAAALGNVIGPLLAGLLFDNVHPNAAMWAAGLVTLSTIGTGLALGFYRIPVTRPTQAAPAPVVSQPAPE
jgi:DHA1 family tetracycline resistance protein-like MFS transporter